MKTFGLVCLWAAALGIALWLLLRFRRGKPLVLKGTLTPRLARLVVVILLAVGVSARSATAEDPEKEPAQGQAVAPVPVPEILNRNTILHWRRSESRNMALRKRYTKWRLTADAEPPAPKGPLIWPPRLGALVRAEYAAAGGPLPKTTAATLTAVLAEAEVKGFISPFTVALVWRWSRTLPTATDAAQATDRLALQAGLVRHARLANALIKAFAEVKPLSLPPRAWMSKAGPKRSDQKRENKAQRDLLAAARKHYPKTDAAPWSTEGKLSLTVEQASAAVTVRRAGQSFAAAPGQVFRLGRLDLIDTRANQQVVLEHAWVGRMVLPGGQLLAAWNLAAHLDPAAKARIESVIARALDDDEDAAARVGAALPLIHAFVSEALAARPEAKGAARLRMHLHLLEN